MQSAGHLVAAVAELAAGVQHGQGQRDGRNLLLGVLLTGIPRPLSDHPDATAGQDPYVDGVAVAGQSLVDGVVDHLVDQVVQAALAGGSDVHPRALPNRVETLQHGDRGRVVRPGVDGGGTDLVQITRRLVEHLVGQTQLLGVSFLGRPFFEADVQLVVTIRHRHELLSTQGAAPTDPRCTSIETQSGGAFCAYQMARTGRPHHATGRPDVWSKSSGSHGH